MKTIFSLILLLLVSAVNAFSDESVADGNLIEIRLGNVTYLPNGYKFRRILATCQWSDLITGYATPANSAGTRKYSIIWPSEKRLTETELDSVTVVVNRWELEGQTKSASDVIYLRAIDVKDIIEKKK